MNAAEHGAAGLSNTPEGWTDREIVDFKVERGVLNLGVGSGSVHLFKILETNEISP